MSQFNTQFQNNGKLKLLIIVGTRPEIIRLSAVITKCRKYFDTILAHTGQNYDYNLNGVFFRDLKLADPELARALMEDILSGGNFGRKDRQRGYEGMFISNRGKDGVRNRRISQGVQALTRITYMKYPLIEKYPVLLPFGWAAAFGGYLVRTRERNKKGYEIHALSAFQKSASRISLYQQLGLFEPEQR